jgi:hypothetical protein
MNDPVEMEFYPDGVLTYAVKSAEGWNVLQLTYEIDGTRLVTDQPSWPRKEVTEFEVAGDGSLVLNYGGARCRFVRRAKEAPDVRNVVALPHPKLRRT